jgi:hypothetical protein
MAITTTTTSTQTVSGNSYLGQAPLFSEIISNTSGNIPGSFVLANGFNSISIPATAVGVIIVPPSGSSVTKTLKGVTGDTGIPIDPANSTRLKFTAGQNSAFGITANGAETIGLLWE